MVRESRAVSGFGKSILWRFQLPRTCLDEMSAYTQEYNLTTRVVIIALL